MEKHKLKEAGLTRVRIRHYDTFRDSFPTFGPNPEAFTDTQELQLQSQGDVLP